MRHMIMILNFTFFLVLLGCGEGPDVKQADKAQSSIKKDNGGKYESVCDCFDAAIDVLDKAITLRMSYSTEEDYLANAESVKEMKTLVKMWHAIQKECLLSFGVKVFNDETCDRGKELAEKRKKLRALGISN